MPAATDAPWWETLPHDFHREAVTTDADVAHPWQVRGTAAIDVLLRTGVATMLSATMLPLALFPGRLERELDRLAFYRDAVDAVKKVNKGSESFSPAKMTPTPYLPTPFSPDSIFIKPPPDVVIRNTPAALTAYRPQGIPVEWLRFTSPYQALNPALREEYARHGHNHQTAAQYWTHPGGPRPTLIFLHGFLADAYWINSVMFSLRWFWQQGFDVLLVTLPFHGARQSPFSPFSGAGYFANGFSHLNEAMLQAVFDVRIFMNALQQRGVPAMGISGLSLGGYLSALTASVDDRLSFCIPNAPVVSPADMLMEWAPISWLARAAMRNYNLSVADIRHSLALHCPLTWQPKLSPDRLLIIGGAGDRFTAPRYVRQLHRHWQGSQLHWFPGNHVMHLQQRTYLRLMREFMRAAVTAPATHSLS